MEINKLKRKAAVRPFTTDIIAFVTCIGSHDQRDDYGHVYKVAIVRRQSGLLSRLQASISQVVQLQSLIFVCIVTLLVIFIRAKHHA